MGSNFLDVLLRVVEGGMEKVEEEEFWMNALQQPGVTESETPTGVRTSEGKVERERDADGSLDKASTLSAD